LQTLNGLEACAPFTHVGCPFTVQQVCETVQHSCPQHWPPPGQVASLNAQFSGAPFNVPASCSEPKSLFIAPAHAVTNNATTVRTRAPIPTG
jgi:hypothetical protein